MYRRDVREVAAGGSGGEAYLPTLTHEVVHALLQTEAFRAVAGKTPMEADAAWLASVR